MRAASPASTDGQPPNRKRSREAEDLQDDLSGTPKARQRRNCDPISSLDASETLALFGALLGGQPDFSTDGRYRCRVALGSGLPACGFNDHHLAEIGWIVFPCHLMLPSLPIH